MANACGHLFLIEREDPATPGTFVAVAGLRSNSISINKEQVDVTDKASMAAKNKARQLINCGVTTVSLSGSGVAEDEAAFTYLNQVSLDGTIENYRITSELGDSYEGAFQVSNFERSADHNDSEQFSASWESADEITYTPAP